MARPGICADEDVGIVARSVRVGNEVNMTGRYRDVANICRYLDVRRSAIRYNASRDIKRINDSIAGCAAVVYHLIPRQAQANDLLQVGTTAADGERAARLADAVGSLRGDTEVGHEVFGGADRHLFVVAVDVGLVVHSGLQGGDVFGVRRDLLGGRFDGRGGRGGVFRRLGGGVGIGGGVAHVFGELLLRSRIARLYCEVVGGNRDFARRHCPCEGIYCHAYPSLLRRRIGERRGR